MEHKGDKEMTFMDPKESMKDRKKRFILQTDAKTERLKDGHKDATRRFKFLLNLTDLFSHFINISIKKNPELSRIVKSIEQQSGIGTSRRGAARGNGRKSTRRRKTEKEEDLELMHDEEFEEETTVLEESPSFVNGTLRDYQIQGLNWLISLHQNSLSGILADEMGLGKTLQTISFLGYLRYYEKIDGPHIVIVPKSTLDNWRREFSKWTPEVNVLVLQGNKDDRNELIKTRLLELKFDVCITSFEMVIREKLKFSKIKWQYIIVDELHRIKNEESSLSQIIRLFYSRNRLLITGTPLQNNLHELWALLNFLLPDVFGDANTFNEWFENQETDQDLVVQQLHKVLSPFLLRRIKADVEKSLLPKKEVNLYIGMTDMQIKWYKNLLEKDIDAVNGVVGKREGKTRLLNIVMQLRKCCNHPYLFEGAEPGPPFTTDEHLVFNAGKMIILDKLLKRLKSQGSRVLIFSQMSRLLDILEDYCYFRDYEYCRIDGSTSHEDRILAIDDYNAEDSDKFIFLLTTRAGGLGINLTSADIVILYDSDWNPQLDLQLMDRAHRIGQKKQVYVYRFVTENAIEEKVLERALQKLRLDQLVIQQGRLQQLQSAGGGGIGNSKDDLIDMIQHGAKKVFETSKNTMVDDDIDEILKKGEEKTKNLNQKFSKLGLDDLQNFTSEQASLYEWNGENFAKRPQDKVSNWINPRKRERKELTYSVDEYYKDMWLLLPKSAPPPKLPRLPKHYNIYDHQFYPRGLVELLEREQLLYKKKIRYRVTLSEFGDSDEDLLESDDERESRESKRLKEQLKIDLVEELTEEEMKLKEEYLSQGFSDWNKRDFGQFIQLCAKYGRENYQQIASEMHTKSVHDVASYSKVFWERLDEIDGHERYRQQIESGEEKIAKILYQQDLLNKKMALYTDPLQELLLKYPPNNSKRIYTDLEDRFLLLQLYKHGLKTENLFKIIKQEINEHEFFKFDWFFNSRSPLELNRRCQTLLLGITREFEGANYKKRKINRRSKTVGVKDGEEAVDGGDEEEEEDEEDAVLAE